MPEVTPREVMARRARGEKILLLDVREHNEWNLFRIPGALHMPLAAVAGRAGELDPSAEIVVYCSRGTRSASAAALLRERDFSHVSSLAGGVMAWVSAGGDVDE